VGEEALLPEAARAFLSNDSLRRVALALDDEEIDHSPPLDQTGGARIYCAKTDRYVLSLAVLGDEPPLHPVREVGRHAAHRIEAHLEGERRDRRRRFLGHRLITRVADKNHVMGAEVRRMLETLCDKLLEIEENLAAGADSSEAVLYFRGTLDELVAWPKGGSESFQRNLEILQDSMSDFRADDLSTERLEAVIAGLEVTIESWLLP